jgi:hypothetical protein
MKLRTAHPEKPSIFLIELLGMMFGYRHSFAL